MAHIMTKRGNLDNIVTYQHICDTTADLSNISQEYRTLGSIAIVIEGQGGGLEVYITNSNKQWILLSMSNNSNSDIPITTNLLHILTANEYDTTTHIPTIVHPEENVIYLVPSTNQENTNLFDEWIYTGNNWEKFSSTSITANMQPDWKQNDENAADYIKNRICYTDDPIEEVLIDAVCEKTSIREDIYSLQANSSSQISFNYNENDIFEFSYAGQVYYRGTLQFYETYYSYDLPSDSNSLQYETYYIDLIENFFSIYSNRPSPDSGRFIVKRISQNIEKLDPKYLPVNIRAGTNEGIIEGMITKNIASGEYSHAQGYQTTASGEDSHAQGNYTTASGHYSHAEGVENTASGRNSHAQGGYTTASGESSHAQGYYTTASGIGSHAQGYNTTASGSNAHVEGISTIANHCSQHVFGEYNLADDHYSLAGSRGNYIEIVGNGTNNYVRSNARTLDWSGNEWLAGNITLEGSMNRGRAANTTIGLGSFAFGGTVTASGQNSHAQGSNTTASSFAAHAQGTHTTASGSYSHAQGNDTTASKQCAHAQGFNTTASGNNTHAQGNNTTASGSNAHAEGNNTTASRDNSHAQGQSTVASGFESHAEGNSTLASGPSSHAQGHSTIANHSDQHVFGRCNIADNNPADVSQRGTYVEIVGNGTDANNRSNARTLDWNGNQTLAGTLTTSSNGITIGNTTLTEAQLQSIFTRLAALEQAAPASGNNANYIERDDGYIGG